MNKYDDANGPDIEALLDDDGQVERAMAKGVQAALLQHKQAWVPMVVWQDGRIKWIPADQIQVDEPPTAKC